MTINSGDTLYIRGYNLDGFSSSINNYCTFIIEGDKVSCSANIMSLIDYKNLPDVIPCEYCFYGLFENCDALTTAPELPANNLAEWCYAYMFKDCTSLKIAPESSTNISNNYLYTYNMFDGCKFKIAFS